MSFFGLETKHLVLIVIGLAALYILVTYDRKENYSPIQTFPFIPPKFWNPLTTTYWAPWYYTENPWDTVVPKVSLVDSSQYQLPNKDAKKEGFGMPNRTNLVKILVALVLVGLLYYLYTMPQEAPRLIVVEPPAQQLLEKSVTMTEMKGGMPAF